MREQRDELVTIEGIVVGAATDRSPVVTAALVIADGALPIEHRASFDVELRDGRRVTIEPAKNPVIRPTRKHAGPWRELEHHPVRPTGDFHPDGHVKLRGEWIVPGEPVVVVGYVKEHEFVPETGGHREAPERQVALVRAIAIGVGEDAAADVKKAVKDREREIEARATPKPDASNTTWAWRALGAFVLAALFVFVELRWHSGTTGLALTCVIFGLLFGWRASPTQMFPGGAVDKDEVTDPGTMVGFLGILLVPLVIVLFLVGGAEKRDGVASAGWIMLGLFPIGRIVLGMLAKPRAEAGSQVELPASAIRRWILVLGLIATWIAAIALVAPHVSGDGPMT